MTTEEDGIGRAAEEISDHQGILGTVVHKDRCEGVLGCNELSQELHILKASLEGKKPFILHRGHVPHGTCGRQYRLQGLYPFFMDGHGVIPRRIRVRPHLGNEQIQTSIQADRDQENERNYEAGALIPFLFRFHSTLTSARIPRLSPCDDDMHVSSILEA